MDTVDHLRSLPYISSMVTTTATKLKASLGKYLRAVREGEEVVVTDREVPIARLVPIRADEPKSRQRLVIKPHDPSAPRFGDLVIAGIDYHGPSTLELLREDRDKR
mgnify:CR=1 FL=1